MLNKLLTQISFSGTQQDVEGGGGPQEVDEEGVVVGVRDKVKVLRDEKEALRGVVVSRGEGMIGGVMVREEDEGTGVTKLQMSEMKETSLPLLLQSKRLDLGRNGQLVHKL